LEVLFLRDFLQALFKEYFFRNICWEIFQETIRFFYFQGLTRQGLNPGNFWLQDFVLPISSGK